MDSLQEDVDMELPSCPVCQEEYGSEGRVPMVLQCGHSICKQCLETFRNQAASDQRACPTCRAPVSGNWDNLPKNFKLEEAVTIIKKLREPPSGPENPVKCCHCEKVDDEADMFVCRTCVKEIHKYDIREPMNPDAQLEIIKEMGICSICAHRNHVDRGHETSPFFALSSGCEFTTHFTAVTLLKEDLEKQASRVAEWSAHFEETTKFFFAELDKMTDMMRKSKSSSIQRNFAKKIEKEIDAFSQHTENIVQSISEAEDVYLKKFEALKKRNEQENAVNCREFVAKEAEKLCQECAAEYKREKMYCCQMCSEVVAELLSGKLNEAMLQGIQAVGLDHLLVCATCVVDNHVGQNHKPIKFADVQKSYDLAMRRFRVDKKEQMLRSRFSNISDTFQNYNRFIQDYEDKITKMSRIMAECKQENHHELVLSSFEMTLDDAETAIESIQVHSKKEQSPMKETKRAEVEVVEDVEEMEDVENGESTSNV